MHLKKIHRDKGTKVVSKRVDDFRERTQPQLGTVHDPIRDTMNVTPDHSFGILIRPDEYGAGDLIHSRLPGEYLRGKDRQRGLLAAVRQQLKKANYHNFNNLQAAFKHYDKVKSQLISICGHDCPIYTETMQFCFDVLPQVFSFENDFHSSV